MREGQEPEGLSRVISVSDATIVGFFRTRLSYTTGSPTQVNVHIEVSRCEIWYCDLASISKYQENRLQAQQLVERSR